MSRWLVLFLALSFSLCPVGLAEALDDAPEALEADTSEPDPREADEDLEYDPLFDEDFDLELDATASSFPDPLEGMNRGTLVLNQGIDKWLLDPVTRFYRFLMPERVRRASVRFFDNVNSPQVFVNDIFQLEWHDAGIVVLRLVINSTVGLAGLFDPATKWGLEKHDSDFGQTLALAGAPSGLYFVIPLLGPTTVRDGLGLGVDALFHPTFYLLGGTDLLFFGGSAGLTARARHFEELKALEESSVDFYAALRSGYYQNRIFEIWGRREVRRQQGQD